MTDKKVVGLKPVSKRRGDFSTAATRQYALVNAFPEDTFGGVERETRIFTDQIASLYAVGDDISVITISSGQRVYIKMPIDETHGLIESGQVELDLRSVTGSVIVSELSSAYLRERFNLAALTPHMEQDDLIIFAYVLGRNSQNARARTVAFCESDFQKIGEDDEYIFLYMNDWDDYKNDWQMDLNYGPYLQISKSEFEAALSKAREHGAKFVDLLDQTRPDNYDDKAPLKVPSRSKWLAKANKS